MKFGQAIPLSVSMVILGALIWLLAAPVGGASVANATNVLHVPKDFSTIQAAVDASSPGDIIQVARGTFSENVVIDGKSDLRLQGRKTVLQGSGSGLGFHLLDSEHIRVQGFIVDGYELGVLLEGTDHSHIHNLEARNNDSPDRMLRDGVALWESHNNRVTNVNAHDNGHNGITLRNGSTGNTLQGNVTNDNGKNPAVAPNRGCGIQLVASGNNGNTVAANEALRNGWGIQVGGGSNDNRVVQNRSHENRRAGVAALDSASGNFIGQNNATGNGLADVAPSGTFDLFDQGALDNTWRNNQGNFNH